MTFRKTILLMFVGAAIAAAYTFEENTALQFQEYARASTSMRRREELRKWFAAKRPLRPAPETARQTAFSANGIALALDNRHGYPVSLTIGESGELLANYAASFPLFELHFIDRENKRRSAGNYGKTPTIRQLDGNAGVELTWSLPEATVTTRIDATEDGFARFSIQVRNLLQDARLDSVDYPMLAIRPRGDAATSIAVIPDRRGRLRPLTDLVKTSIKEYPCSNARFQMTAFYDSVARKGVYFAAQDTDGWEKEFIQSYMPEYGLTFLALRRHPLQRGVPGNSMEESFPVVLGAFDGDWYDAAQLYRRWTLKQPWAANGPLYANREIPEFIKHAPVYLRFYLRASQGKTPAQVEKMSRDWADFLPGRLIPAELFHYSAFKEPEPKGKYPVCEYYGYKAKPFPGLPEALRNMHAMGIRCAVFLQSEIINQKVPENDTLKPAYKTDASGVPRLYLGERSYVCRNSPVWLARTEELVNHLIDIGFCGVYLDTFGKSKPDFECFSAEHGHPAGGGNTDVVSQRTYGTLVRKVGRARNPEFYMVGEACTEPYMDILDIKENATHTDPGSIPLERTIFGDYYLPHGRTISDGNVNYTKFLGLDFLNGMIPGRFFDSPPKDPNRRRVLREVIDYTDAGYEYLRCGQMLRTIPFAVTGENVTVEEMGSKIPIARWQCSVFRSCKDSSIAFYVFHFGDSPARNTLILPDGKEWGIPPSAKLFRMDSKGNKTLLGTLGDIREIPLDLPSDGIAAFFVQP